MEWLPNWSNRIKFTVDNSKIQTVLYNFPVLVKLDTTYSGVFNTLGSNSKRMCFITSDTYDYCYCEVAYWEAAANTAQLWVKLPTVVASGTGVTEFYMYYDNTQSDHFYIGTTGETSAKAVWDSNFSAVYHMSQDPSIGGACILDSTSNSNSGTPSGLSTNDSVQTDLGKAIVVAGTDYISVAHNASIAFTTSYSIEIILTPQANVLDECILAKGNVNGQLSYGLSTSSAEGKYAAFSEVDGTWGPTHVALDTEAKVPNEELFITSTFNGSTTTLYKNGLFIVDQTTAAITLYASNTALIIGKHPLWSATAANFRIRELRLSSTARSSSWIKTTYYSNFDNLLLYYPNETYTEPIPEEYFFHGYIKELSQPVTRKVSLYNKATGNLIDTTMSDPYTGYYLLASFTNDEHFIVTFDDEYGTTYNPLIRDNFLPNGK